MADIAGIYGALHSGVRVLQHINFINSARQGVVHHYVCVPLHPVAVCQRNLVAGKQHTYLLERILVALPFHFRSEWLRENHRDGRQPSRRATRNQHAVDPDDSLRWHIISCLQENLWKTTLGVIFFEKNIFLKKKRLSVHRIL